MTVPLVHPRFLFFVFAFCWVFLGGGEVCIARSLVFCVMLCRSLFVLFPLVIVLPVVLRFTAYDYPFGILKPFFPRHENPIHAYAMQLLVTH